MFIASLFFSLDQVKSVVVMFEKIIMEWKNLLSKAGLNEKDWTRSDS